MKGPRVIVLLAVFFVGSASRVQAQPSFSGTWSSSITGSDIGAGHDLVGTGSGGDGAIVAGDANVEVSTAMTTSGGLLQLTLSVDGNAYRPCITDLSCFGTRSYSAAGFVTLGEFFEIRRRLDGVVLPGGYFELNAEVRGRVATATACCPTDLPTGHYGNGAARLSFVVNGVTQAGVGAYSVNGYAPDGASEWVDVNTKVGPIRIPIGSNGIGSLSSSLSGGVSCLFTLVGSTCSASVLAGKSAHFGGLRVFDLNGNPIPLSDLIITTGSGFDYSAPLPSANSAPTANAGPDQSTHAGDTVHLNGSASSDDNTDSALLSYAWSFLAYPGVSAPTLTGADTATPSFVANTPGDYELRLVVTDEGGLSSAATAESDVKISSNNQAPTAAIISTTVTPLVSSPVFLDGTTSTDPDGDQLTYSWTLIAQPPGSPAWTSFDPSPVLIPVVEGTYQVRLTVSDSYDAGDPPAEYSFFALSMPGFVESEIVHAADIVNGLSNNQVVNKGNQKEFTKLLRNATRYVDRGSYCRADSILDEAISRTDGFPLRGALDARGEARDWITDAAVQAVVYGDLTSAKDALGTMLNCGEVGDGYEHHEGDGHNHRGHYQGDGHKHQGPDRHDDDR